MNLATMAEDAIERVGDIEGLVFDAVRYSNTQLFGYSKRIHRRLEDLGVGRGSTVVLCMVNHPLIFPAFGGIFRSGATAVPAMFILSAPELRYIVSDCRAEGIVTDTHNLDKVRIAVDGLDHVRWIAVVGGEDRAGAVPEEFALEGFLESEPRDSLPRIDDEDLAIMLYTSGTTGKPKGVMLTHANIAAQGDAIIEASNWESWEGPVISISAMPMAHIFGVGVMVSGYVMPQEVIDRGGYGVQMAWFDPEPFMALIQEHRCNTMPAVPTMLSLILNHPKLPRQGDLRADRVHGTGLRQPKGSSLPARLRRPGLLQHRDPDRGRRRQSPTGRRSGRDHAARPDGHEGLSQPAGSDRPCAPRRLAAHR
jgi:long-chain acyl-CoA synthetase